MELQPEVGLGLTGRHGHFEARYGPRILFLEPYLRLEPELLHQAYGLWGYAEADHRLFVSEYFSYGVADFSTLAAQLDPLVVLIEPLPEIVTVRLLYSLTQAGYSTTLGTRHQLAIGAGYLIGGGNDPLSRVLVPLQTGLRANASLYSGIGRHDAIGTLLEGSYSGFLTGQPTAMVDRRATLLQGTERWRHTWSRHQSTELGAGVAAVRLQPSPRAAAPYRLYPALEAAYNHQRSFRSQRFEFRGSAQLEPFLDRFAANIYQRAGAGGQLLYRQGYLTVDTRGGLGWGLGGSPEGSGWTALLESVARYNLTPQMQLEVGYLSGWGKRPGEPLGFQWQLHTAFTYRERWRKLVGSGAWDRQTGFRREPGEP